MKHRPKGASLSINENIQKRLIEKKIECMLKKNEYLYAEKAKEKEYINNLLFPSYDINQILEPEEENEAKKQKKPEISLIKSYNLNMKSKISNFFLKKNNKL